MDWYSLTTFLQFAVALLACVYFARMIAFSMKPKLSQPALKSEQEHWRRLRERRLSEPLSEKARPQKLNEIVGQDEALQVLLAALSGPYPQHILLYGPPGVGKTAAARLALGYAKASNDTPFTEEAPFVELDASLVRFDERGIADPLLGSVHDPIYQGAGALGASGVPQPKPGAVTRAHGGVLFLDEIGELHPIQLNKLLKVLEDRKVMPESSYYSLRDDNTPPHIHDLFQNGLPADFRLIGATTRRPEELPSALRSRCVEIFFKPLQKADLITVAERAALKLGCFLDIEGCELIGRVSQNGRDAVNLIQLAAGQALQRGERKLTRGQLEWMAGVSMLELQPDYDLSQEDHVGRVHILGVGGPAQGQVMELHLLARACAQGESGRLVMTGVVDEEEVTTGPQTTRRRSQVSNALENVRSVLAARYSLDLDSYDLHLDFPNGLVDGPSAGIAMAVAIYSGIQQRAVVGSLAMTGALSVLGEILPVGGVGLKLEAARRRGLKRVLVPKANWQESFVQYPELDVIAVHTIEEVFEIALCPASNVTPLRQEVAGTGNA